MKVVIQRVSNAQVEVDKQVVGEIKTGLLLLLGIAPTDSIKDIEYLCKKIVQLRIFNDTNGQMNLSVQDVAGDILLISQFTLYANTLKGNRPSFIEAAKPDLAIPLYENFKLELEKNLTKPIQTGIFGADMQVTILNDGPVTITIESHLDR
jgi:D-aminoacyl-tRNA deacylase